MKASAHSPAAAETGFRLDLNRCTGCQACVLACIIENELPVEGAWRRVEDFNPAGLDHAPAFHLSTACNHCETSPCATACPTNAYRRDAATGALLINAEACIGCRYCSWACPFDAPRFDARSRTMGKCTLCAPRLAEGRRPACVESCPTGALGAGSMAEIGAGGAVAALAGFPLSAAQPRLRLLPLRPGALGPASDLATPPGGDFAAPPGPPEDGGRRLHLRDEWPLVLFTWAAPFLVALKLDTLPPCRLDRPWPILVGGLVAMGLSAAHLGRPLRAWRALAGIGHSWLSREIAAFALFVVLAGALPLAFLPEAPYAIGLAGALAGLAALYAMDRLYGVALPMRGVAGLHGAEALFTAMLYTVALREWEWALYGMLALKLALWLARQGGQARPWRALALLRPLLGLALPAALVMAGQSPRAAVVLALIAAGELIDRADFYCALRFPSPRRELDRALAAR
jgi:Fe-S-cluster-containing dehydrogenase component/DMSO reductase anchor subunit